MPDIVCPRCSKSVPPEHARRDKDGFCEGAADGKKCDFPLFWAPSAMPKAPPESSEPSTLRRLPGAGGLQRLGTKVCPKCGELNPLVDTLCSRCTKELEPKPLPPTQPEPVVIVVPPPPPPPPPPPEEPWWWPLGVVAAAVLSAAAVVMVVAIIASR